MGVFGTYEWAVKNVNIVSGCSHNCKYCYSREMAIRFKRKTPESWKEEQLLSSYSNIRIGNIKGQVMFPSTHDITPENLELSIRTIKAILRNGNKILIVSKPHIPCIKSICDNFQKYKEQILFRFTIGSSNDSVLKFWEPSAPLFNERLESLMYAYNNGFKTSVSCEPMLDNKISNVIDQVFPFVTDSIWLGKMNFLIRRLRINGYLDIDTIEKANKLLDWQSDTEIMKLYNTYKFNPKIKWKESIKKIAKIDIPETKGLDK